MQINAYQAGTEGRIRVVAVQGEMDIGATGVDAFRAQLDELVEEGVRHVVLDLGGSTYIVSRGFGQMLVAMTRLRARRGDLRVAAAHGPVWTAASTVGLDNILKFYSTVEEAVTSFEQELRQGQ